MGAGESKHTVLGLIFLKKYISDAFGKRYAILVADQKLRSGVARHAPTG